MGGARTVVLAGLCLVAAGVPLAFSVGLASTFTLPKLVLLTAGLLIAAVGLLLSPPGALKATPLDRPLGLCAVVLTICTLTSQDRLLSLLGRYDSYAYGLWGLLLLACVYYIAAGLSEDDRARVLRVSLLVGGVVGAYALVQVTGHELFAGIGKMPTGRAVSTLGSPVDLGAFLATLAPLGFYWALSRAGERLFGAAMLLLIVGGLVASVARAAWLGAGLGCASYLVFAYRERMPGLKRLSWKTLAAAGALVVCVSVGGLSVRAKRQADLSRIEVWKTAWHVFLAHPALGTGLDTFEQDFRRSRTDEFIRLMDVARFQAYAHNDALQVLATTGLLGAAAYLYLLFAFLPAAKRALDGPEDALLEAALCAGLLGVFINVKFNPVALEVLMQISLLTGLLLSRQGRALGPAGQKAAVAGLFLLSAVSVLGALRMTQADRQIRLGQRYLKLNRPELATAPFERAMSLNPCEGAYPRQFINELGDRINASKDVAVRLRLLESGTEAGRKAVACHPSEVNSHYMYGMAALMKGQLGLPEGLPLAAREFDAALELDPKFTPLLQSRLDVATRMGDTAKAAEIKTRIEALDSLVKPLAR